METQLKLATERAEELRKQMRTVEDQRMRAEAGHTQQMEKLRGEDAKRLRIVEALSTADESSASKLHRELDALEASLTATKRLADSHGIALQKANDQLAALHQEFAEVQKIITQEKRAEAMRAHTAKLTQASRSFQEAMDEARKRLGEFAILAYQGEQQFEIDGMRISQSLFEGLEYREANWQNSGWRQVNAPLGNRTFIVRALVRV